MIRSRLVAHLRSLLLLTVAALALAAAPAGAAAPLQAGPPYTAAEWAGWGLSASFEGGTPRVKFAAYVGRNGTPPVVLGKIVEDISGQCAVRDANGDPTTLSVDGAGYASFDGDVYIACETPDWRAMISALAPQLRPAKVDNCECPAARSPFWAASELVVQPVAPGSTRTNMLLDASELGLSFSLETIGTAAITRLERTSGAYESGTWLYDSVGGNRVLAGQSGPLDVAVIDEFGGLPFLSGAGWRPFFINSVRNNRFGQWLEPGNSATFTSMPNVNYTLNTRSQTVYIGRENSSGAMLQARMRHLRVDPGCYGN